jgi:hypothetical protein
LSDRAETSSHTTVLVILLLVQREGGLEGNCLNRMMTETITTYCFMRLYVCNTSHHREGWQTDKQASIWNSNYRGTTRG